MHSLWGRGHDGPICPGNHEGPSCACRRGGLLYFPSARALAVDDRFGSIAIGKTADLALIDGDPLVDMNLIGQPVQGLFMDGKLVIDRCGLVARPAAS